MAVNVRPRSDFVSQTIDVHAHVGASLKAYAQGEYPYAQTAEGLAYRMRACGVDAAAAFPLAPELYFDLTKLAIGEMAPADEPVSPAPYAAENRMLMREVFDFCPELSDRFLPFVCIDPARAIDAQVAELKKLEIEYPIHGIKVNPVLCQSKVIRLLDAGAPLLDFAEGRGLPLLIHTTPFGEDEYSQAADVFQVIEARPGLRFCLAHCLLFHKEYLRRADVAPNLWVDTAAMKIQVELVAELFGGDVRREDCIDADYPDYLAVMRTLCETYPDTIIWGTDSPAYAYICRRKQADGVFRDFNYKATYDDEVAALNVLGPDLRRKVGGTNALDFIFGPDDE